MCGKVSPTDRFDPDVVEQHVVERLVRRSVGGRRGSEWTRGLDLSSEEWTQLQRSLWTALRRVQSAAAAAGEEVVSDPAADTVDPFVW